MKTSTKWLSQYVDIPWQAQELADKLTMAGLEVEDILAIGTVPDGVIVAEIVARRPHPNADKLSLCDVATGAGETVQVVCGAPNCDAGAKVPMATVGTVLGEGFKVKKAKLRGEVSFGMLCSERELGISDDHSGLMLLPPDAPVGAPLSDCLGSDTVIDWEITPNRPDWLSHIGIAREIAALAGNCETLRLPSVDVASVASMPAGDVASVEIRDPDLCPRYIARVIRNVKIGPSPQWMQEALSAVGLRPINNVVDITNYVLLECGQPLHAFDLALLADSTIVVRRAGAGETLVTLDEQKHELTPDCLLIADAEKGVALAGVMGGANSEIAATTTDVLLESAAFLASNIRATSKALGISTEASYRFERGVDIEMVEFASQRAAALICELAGGELLEGKIDAYPGQPRQASVTCRFERINQLLGVEVAPDQAIDYMERLGLTILKREEGQFEAMPPPYRLDLEREADLIEEVARLYGLDNIPAQPAPACVGGPMASDTYYPQEQARAQLLALGLDETVTYSLLGTDTATTGTGVAESELIKLANPLSSETACMRPSLIPGLLQTVAHNVAHNSVDLAFFEFGRVLVNAPGWPEERDQIGIVLTGHPHAERFGAEKQREYDLFDLKGLLEGWLRDRRIQAAECRPVDCPTFAQGRSAAFAWGDTQLAVFGEVAGELTQDIRLKHPLFIALIELQNVLEAPTSERTYQPLPQFPAVVRDISLIADSGLANQSIVDTVLSMKCPWLQKIELFDVYEDKQALGRNKQRLAYSLTYRDPGKTLTDEQVNEAHERIRQGLAKQLDVELR